MSTMLPPCDIGAEQSLIGAALLRQQVVETMKGLVDPSDFYKPSHQHIWAAMLEMHEIGYPIDVVTVGDAVRKFDIGIEQLSEAMNATPSVSAAQRYADIIVETSRRRRLMAHLSELSQRCYEEDADVVLGDVDPSGDTLISRRDSEIKGLFTLGEFVTAASSVQESGDWLVPHILRPRWRVIVVAGEGVGKGTLMRFIGLHAAAGRDPFNTAKFIEPRRVTYIDTENPNTTILHQVKIANLDVDFVGECEDRYSIWHREGGMNLRDRRTRADMESVLQKTRPEIVFAGPLYKLTHRKSGEDMEQATLELLEILDDFRVRFNFALMIEHHAPKGSGISGHREMNPFGSSVLLRWPEFGITLEQEGHTLPNEDLMTLNVGRFRRDREQADWPDTITRGKMGQRAAWIGRWPLGRNRFNWPY